MSRHKGTYPTYNEHGMYTITKPSGWIVTRTNDYEAGSLFASENGYTIGLSR